MRLGQQMQALTQWVLSEWGILERTENIGVVKGPLRKCVENDGILRAGYENIHGIDMNSGLDIAWEIE